MKWPASLIEFVLLVAVLCYCLGVRDETPPEPDFPEGYGPTTSHYGP